MTIWQGAGIRFVIAPKAFPISLPVVLSIDFLGITVKLSVVKKENP